MHRRNPNTTKQDVCADNKQANEPAVLVEKKCRKSAESVAHTATAVPVPLAGALTQPCGKTQRVQEARDVEVRVYKYDA